MKFEQNNYSISKMILLALPPFMRSISQWCRRSKQTCLFILLKTNNLLKDNWVTLGHNSLAAQSDLCILDDLDFLALYKNHIHSIVGGISLQFHEALCNGLSALCNTRYKCMPATGFQSKSYFKMGKNLVTKQRNMHQPCQICFQNL